MGKYTLTQLVGILSRVERCYFADLRLIQLRGAFMAKGMPMDKRFIVNKLGWIYVTEFYTNLSELFRFFGNDEELSKRLKTSKDERLLFRKKFRHVAAKSHDYNETKTEMMPYIDSLKGKGIDWHSEFLIILQYVKELMTEFASKAGPFFFFQSLRGIQAFVMANPPNFDYPKPDLKKDLNP